MIELLITSTNDVIQELRGHNNFLIISHKRPDGDTLGSASALCLALRGIGKVAFVAENEDVTPRYSGIIEQFYTENYTPDYIISVDAADTKLFTPQTRCYADRIDLCIDHHASNTMFAKKTFLNADCAATAELIYYIIDALGLPITKDIAHGLYIGISTDTGCFKFSNTNVNVYKIAIKCLESGLNISDINKMLFDTKTRARIEIEKFAYQALEFYKDGRIALLYLSRKAIEQSLASADDLDSITSITSQIEGVHIGITVIEQKKGVKLSVRTSDEYNASDICSNFGGGGHKKAAGAMLDMGAEEALQKILGVVLAWMV